MFKVFFFILFSSLILQANSLQLSSKMEGISTRTSLSFFEDTKKKMDIEDIKNLEFKSKESIKLNQGVSNSNWWLKLKVKNATNKPIKWVLKFQYGQFDELKSWQYSDKNTIISHFAKGDHFINLSEISFKERTAFKFHTQAQTDNTIYIKLAYIDYGLIEMFHTIQTQEEFIKHEELRFNILIGIIGALLALLFYNINIWFILRKIEYFWYNIYFIGVVLAVLTFDQIGAHYIWYSSIYMIDVMPFISVLTLFVSFILFSRSFLDTPKTLPSIDKILRALVFINLIVLVLALLNQRDLAIKLLHLISFSFAFFPILGFKLWFDGYKIARGYAIASLVVTVTIILTILRFSDVLQTNELLFWVNRLGFVVEAILLSIALADRITILENDYTNEQKIAKDGLLKAKETVDKTLEVFSDNVIASNSDLKGKITYASNALCKISGFSQEELVGNTHSKLRHPDMPSSVYKELWKTIKSGETWEGEIKNITKDGGHYWTKATIIPEKNSQGDIIAYQSVRHDITPHKAKEEFMANMSHELRTPLNSIIGFSGILQKKLNIKENKELLAHVESSSKHLLTLINDILDLSKINSSEFKIEVHEFNAYSEIIDFLEHLHGLSSAKELVCSINISENLKSTFLGDWFRLSQIVLNLISNAVKFTNIGGRVDFNADYVDGNILFKVSDNGIGISKEIQDKIFKPFTQADNSTTRGYDGTGLGLSITQKLVESMNGKIELESEEGVGSTFIIKIPLAKVSDKTISNEAIQKTEEQRNTLNGHVLVVEDNKTNQMLITMFLEDIGLTFDIANDGLEAVDVYNPQIHKMILMDENMPNMNGIEAMKIIKENHKDRYVPIIALTANAMVGDKERFLAEGMDGYLAKPIDDEELYKVLKQFL